MIVNKKKFSTNQKKSLRISMENLVLKM